MFFHMTILFRERITLLWITEAAEKKKHILEGILSDVFVLHVRKKQAETNCCFPDTWPHSL